MYVYFLHICSQTWPDMLKKVVENCLKVYLGDYNLKYGSEAEEKEKNVEVLKKWLSPFEDRAGLAKGKFPSPALITMLAQLDGVLVPIHPTFQFKGEPGTHTLLGSWREVTTYRLSFINIVLY